MDHLAKLENQSVYILREARKKFKNLAMLWSIGKDSTVLAHLARKAFFGHIPFPLVHVDTTMKMNGMIDYRNRKAKEWGVELVTSTNRKALAEGMGPEKGKVVCCTALKRDPLQMILDEKGYTGIIVGIRRDEEPTRAKERYFSPRDAQMEWHMTDQPPELWDQFNTDFESGTHVRIHPLLHWTEVNIWEYIEREQIEVIDLYFAKDGKRFRSLGCWPCTNGIMSNATSPAEIIEELKRTSTPERAGRAQDQESEDAFESLRRDGYM
ncbi:MAG: sulfate adenylyltransferase subunit 2 [Planctomycetes bacterium]|nr:sulfate adenylyltransferase subunit 2 [Planctomycetota bacterium]